MISDEKILKVHGSADFGGVSPREIVDESVLKVALGYSVGSTARRILRDHRLVLRTGDPYRHTMRLSKRGFQYLHGMISDDKLSIRSLGIFGARS